jgi:hypothetical protein
MGSQRAVPARPCRRCWFFKEEVTMAATFIIKKQPDPLPEGPLASVIFSVPDLGLQARFKGEGSCWQYAFGFEFPTEVNGDGKTRTLWKTVNQGFYEKSTMTALARATGITFQPGDRFDPSTFIGKNLQCIMQQKDKGEGKIFSDITGYLKPATGQNFKPTHAPDEPMPQWLQEKLAARLDKPTTGEDTNGDWPRK